MDAYDRIIEKMRKYPNDIPMVKGRVSEAFREYIKLLFTVEEAQIAQHLEIKPISSSRLSPKLALKLSSNKLTLKIAQKLSLKEISKKVGKSKEDTKRILEDMVDKGCIQDIGGYSFFISIPHLFNIGFKYSKARDRLGIKGAELYQQFFIKEKYYKRYQSSDKGTSITRIVPIEETIDYNSEIQNADEIHRLLDNCKEPIVITDCPCRKRTETLGTRECKGKYPIQESCFQLGLFGEYFLRRGEGKRLTRAEAHEVVENFAKLGLIFTTENSQDPNHLVICCCCECCCALIRGMTRFEEKNEFCSAKSNFIAMVNPDLCKGCKLCEKRCVFNAINIVDKKASVYQNKCYGCGVCAVTCPTKAIQLHRLERSAHYQDASELTDKIYHENH